MSKRQNKTAEVSHFERLIAKGINHNEVRADVCFKRGCLNAIRGVKVLDAGCGTGSFSRRLSKDNTVVGVDLCPKAIEIANGFGEKNQHFIVGDIEDESLFENDIFDVILAAHMLHHFPTIDKVIDNFSRWLKVGGKIIIFEGGTGLITRVTTAPLIRLIWLFNLQGVFGVNETYHSIKTYLTALNKKGFKLSECLPFYPGLSGPGIRHPLVHLNFLIHRLGSMLLPSHLGGTNVVIIAENS